MAKTQAQAAGIAVIVAAALAAGATLAACDAPARPRPWRHQRHTADDAPAPPQGTAEALARQKQEAAAKRAVSLRIWLAAEPGHLNPLVDPDREALQVVEDTVFESLLRLEPAGAAGGPPRLVPHLAESWRVIGNGTEIRVVIRDDIQFHDGDRFTVVDAQFSLDTARSSRGRSPRLKELLADVITVELVGPRELRLLLRRENAYVLRALAEVPMVPEHLYRGAEEKARARAPVGTGPYRLVRWEKGQRISLARNETYWGAAPAIEQVEFEIEPDAARALTRAKRGEIDVLPELIPAHQPQIDEMKDDFEPLRLAPAHLTYLVLNSARPPLDDPRVRAAISLLVDRKQLVGELHGGRARPLAGPIWPGGPGDAASPAAPALDEAAAAGLLDQAGWAQSGSGARERGGRKLHVAFLALGDMRGDAERDHVVSALRKAGFVVEVRPGEAAVLMNRLRSGEFDIALLEWRARADDDLWPLLGTGGARNWGRYSSKAMDAALTAVHAAREPSGRALLLAEVARLCATDWPIVALVAPEPVGLQHRRVRGLVARDGWFAIRALSLAAD